MAFTEDDDDLKNARQDASPAIVDNSNDSIAQLISSIVLSEDEENMLLQNDVREEGEEMEHSANEKQPVDVSSDGTCQMTVPNTQSAINPDRVIILDIQMVFHRGRGALIKELAFKVWSNSQVFGLNMKHDVTDIPAHLLVNYDGSYYDVFTGMNLESGEYDYDDKVIANTLKDFSVVFVKGANKKAVLANVYKRLDSIDSLVNSAEKALSDGRAAYQKPTIINVDGQTADDEDRLFCSTNGMTMATFSFPFVYMNMHLYIKMLYDRSHGFAYNPMEILYFNNVVSKDPRYDILGKGRVVCICQSDHSCGGAIEYFGKKQRCSLLNISILENLWLRGQDTLFRRLVKSEREGSSRFHKLKRQIQPRRQRYTRQWQQQENDWYQNTNGERSELYNTVQDPQRIGEKYEAEHYRNHPEYQSESYGQHQRWQSNGESTYENAQDRGPYKLTNYNGLENNNRVHVNMHGESKKKANEQQQFQLTKNGDYNQSWEDWSYENNNCTEPSTEQRKHAFVFIIKNAIQRRRTRRETNLANRVYKKRDATRKRAKHST